jgi:hypothetical protein
MAFLLPTLLGSGMGLLQGLFTGWGADKQSQQDRQLMDMMQGRRTELQQTMDQRRAELQNFITTQLMTSNTQGLEAQANRGFDRAKASFGAVQSAGGSSESGSMQVGLNAARGDTLANMANLINQDQFARSSAAAGLTSQFDANAMNTLAQFDSNMFNNPAARTPDTNWMDILGSGFAGAAGGLGAILPFLDLPGMGGGNGMGITPQQSGSQNGWRSQRY